MYPAQTPQMAHKHSNSHISHGWHGENLYMSPYPLQHMAFLNPLATPLACGHSSFASQYTMIIAIDGMAKWQMVPRQVPISSIQIEE